MVDSNLATIRRNSKRARRSGGSAGEYSKIISRDPNRRISISEGLQRKANRSRLRPSNHRLHAYL